MRQQLSLFARRYRNLSLSTSGKQQGHPIPISTGRQKIGTGRVFLIGDTASLGEAFFGEGIAFALKSAHIASKHAAGLILGKHQGGSYRQALSPLIEELKYSLFMARGMYALPTWLLELLTRDKKAQGTMVDLLQGNISYKKGFWQMVTHTPRVALSAL